MKNATKGAQKYHCKALSSLKDKNANFVVYKDVNILKTIIFKNRLYHQYQILPRVESIRRYLSQIRENGQSVCSRKFVRLKYLLFLLEDPYIVVVNRFWPIPLDHMRYKLRLSIQYNWLFASRWPHRPRNRTLPGWRRNSNVHHTKQASCICSKNWSKFLIRLLIRPLKQF